MKSLLLLAVILLALARSAMPATWIVAQDGSGDFIELQDAVDAAAPGDLILVKPGVYQGVYIQKPLSIVGSGPDRTVVAELFGDVILGGSLPGGDLLLGSLRAEGQIPLRATSSPTARLIAWNLALVFGDYISHGKACSVWNFDSCWIDRLVQVPGLYPHAYGDPGQPGLGIGGGTLGFVSQCRFQGMDQDWEAPTTDGASGIALGDNATVYIAETDAIGGKGGEGYDVDCILYYQPGSGGHGIWVMNEGRAYVFGRPENEIRGGPGGDYHDYGNHCPTLGGDGGDGIHVDSLEATFSGVQPQGAPGGYGDPPGDPGEPTYGNVTEIAPRVPTSTMTGEGYPGTPVTFSFHATPGDRLLVAYSTEVDVLDLGQTEGHPLLPSPAGTFGVVPAGTIPDGGTASLTCTIPSDAPWGVPFYVQGILLGAHPAQLTNMSMLVVTPNW
ncbi:MAG: hypothetical protein AB1486_07385 [Planctomycetota bacterium]